MNEQKHESHGPDTAGALEQLVLCDMTICHHFASRTWPYAIGIPYTACFKFAQSLTFRSHQYGPHGNERVPQQTRSRNWISLVVPPSINTLAPFPMRLNQAKRT